MMQARLHVTWNYRNLFMLVYMFLPHITPLITETNSFEQSTKVAAFLDIDFPEPIANEQSAAFKLDKSLSPSPMTATFLPSGNSFRPFRLSGTVMPCNPTVISSLSSGFARPTTLTVLNIWLNLSYFAGSSEYTTFVDWPSLSSSSCLYTSPHSSLNCLASITNSSLLADLGSSSSTKSYCSLSSIDRGLWR